MLTVDELRALCEEGESFTVEFKRGRPLSDNDIVEAVVCLTNGSGGTLLLGIEDDGTVSGLAHRHSSHTDPYRLQAMILNNTEPPVATEVSLLQVQGKDVAVVEVPDTATPVGTKRGVFIRRSTKADGSPECIPYRAHEIVSAGLSAHQRDYAEVPARGATLADLDPAEFMRFRALCARGRGDQTLADLSDEDVLRALRVYIPSAPEGQQLSLGAVLLFGTEQALLRYVPTAECIFQELRGGKISTDETVRAPLFKSADRLHEFISLRNFEEELMMGLQRIRVPRVPDSTVRESIANALTHRDYAELGPVHVQLSEDEYRVSSPGGFPPGITLANLLDDSRPRSVVLTDAFKRAGFVDRAGRGVHEMFVSLLRVGRGGPDYSASSDRTVVVTIPASHSDLDMVRFVLTHENDTQSHLPLAQLRIIYEIKTMGPETLHELTSSLRMPDPTIRSQATRLTEAGIVEPRGTGRNRRYHLTAAFFRTAESSAYIRLRDTDPIQQSQMVLAYVDQFGSITRGKVAELCRLSPAQARVVLRRLVDAGDLELQGERRGAHYVRAALR